MANIIKLEHVSVDVRFVEIVSNPLRKFRHPRVDAGEPLGALVTKRNDADLEPPRPVQIGAVAGHADGGHHGAARVALGRDSPNS
jgi:hypothetical protein